MSKEIWKDIGVVNGIDFKGYYQVSNTARVKSIERTIITSNGKKQLFKEKILKNYINDRGYCTVRLSRGSKTRCVRVSRMLAIAFIPNPDNKPNVNHINFIRDDNRIENLEWTTQKENIRHSFRKGRYAVGIAKFNAKLTHKKVMWIRKLLAQGINCYEITRRIKIVSCSTIWQVKVGKTWSHVK